mmetsp:Transcript_66288/g.191347  ORF Transcript_66288/g.191347 Transcript_66288/m.191347 type:complete len:220 (+) Transcript_66288:1958-2617(+)
MPAEALDDLRCEVGVARLRHADLLVQHCEDARLRVQQCDDVSVVLIAQCFDGVNALSLVVLELHLEHMVVEVCLQVLIAQVDRQLLDRVNLERLEARDVQHTKKTTFQASAPGQHAVDVPDQILEEPPVQQAGHAIPRLLRLRDGAARLRGVAHDLDDLCEQALLQWLQIDPEQVGSLGDRLVVLQLAPLAVLHKLSVAQCQDAEHNFEDLCARLLREP